MRSDYLFLVVVASAVVVRDGTHWGQKVSARCIYFDTLCCILAAPDSPLSGMYKFILNAV
jgi:hypothetical protein